MRTRVSVYAQVFTRTHQSFVTKQGFGYSSPLKDPVREISFHYEATWPVDARGVSGSSRAMGDLSELAENFAFDYYRFPKSEAEPVHIDFNPTDKALRSSAHISDGVAELRALTPPEQELFLTTFRQTNEARGRSEGKTETTT